ncbi:class I SAM-dependent methyltransferase [Marinobacter sp. C2H3]|uniref:class I SAM-dependent methyltransferase n=1 Tax=Marinobacter sp. C2H3 TaxID=3119003 RepID=UPI00300EAA52
MNIEDREFLEIVSSSTSRFELWRKVLNATKVKTLVEVGIWKGDFAKEILEQCKNIEKYYMIDPWATLPDWNKPFNVDTKTFDDVYMEAMRKIDFASDKVFVLRGRTKEVIEKIPDESLDFAYIDGDHTLRGITIDLIKLFPKIKNGGFIAGDDFAPSPWQHDIRFEPTLVCPFSIYFAEAMDLPIVALPFNQFLIQKSSKSSFCFKDITGQYDDISLNKLPPHYKWSGVKTRLSKALNTIGLMKKGTTS